MITLRQIDWVAGILDGEGSFLITKRNNYPKIWLGMTDLDIVQRVRNIMNSSTKIINRKRIPKNKEVYEFHLSGSLAIQWMMTLYPLMSNRRREKIREILSTWKSQEYTWIGEAARKRRFRAIQGIMKSKGVSLEEATAIFESLIKKEENTDGTIQ